MKLTTIPIIVLGVLFLGLAVVASAQTPEPSTPPAEAAQIPPNLEIPFLQVWAASGHADAQAEAFKHWDNEKDKAVPADCARCHSTPGYVEFVSTGAVQKPVPIGTVITCIACHNEAAIALNSVQMPSGAKISGLGPEARCMQCHQGRQSTVSVNKLLAGLEDDTVSDKIKFLNVHYFAAGATLFGTQAKGAYEYEGKTYNGRLKHIEPVNTCVECHDVHALKVKVEVCGGCHQGVKTVEDLENIRMVKVDYTGGGNPGEGLAKAIDTLRGKLYAAIQDYAKTIAGKPIVYSADNSPYFFTDLNGNGQPDPDETVAENSYKTWTPRLLRAAYNLQYVTKDPGAFAHNGRYIVQVLQDSLESLGKKVKVDMTGMVRPEVTP